MCGWNHGPVRENQEHFPERARLAPEADRDPQRPERGGDEDEQRTGVRVGGLADENRDDQPTGPGVWWYPPGASGSTPAGVGRAPWYPTVTTAIV